jgi:ribosomal protein L28
LATQYHQHEAGITTRGWKHNIINTKLTSQREAGNTSSTRSWHHNARLATHHHNMKLASQYETVNTSSQHEADITVRDWQHNIISMKLASQYETGNIITTRGWHTSS